MRTRTVDFVMFLALLVCSEASASPVNLRVMVQNGAAFPQVLVIVKSLEGKGEVLRALSDSTGSVPTKDLPSGLYRVIATCPYGPCETKIVEFLVGNAPVSLEIRVDLSATRGNVAIVGPSNRLKIRVLDAEGIPAASAEVLVRDADAEYEEWYKTDIKGEADVEPRGVSTTFVVLYDGTLTSETLSSQAVQKLRNEGKEFVIPIKR